MENIAQSIREKVLRENFDVIGFAKPQIQKEAKLRLRKFLKRGFHGEMNWIPQKTKTTRESKACLVGGSLGNHAGYKVRIGTKSSGRSKKKRNW